MTVISELTLIKSEILEGIKYSLQSQELVYDSTKIMASIINDSNYLQKENIKHNKTILNMFESHLKRINLSSSNLKESLNKIIEHLDNSSIKSNSLLLNLGLKNFNNFLKNIKNKNSAIAKINKDLRTARETLHIRDDITIEDSTLNSINNNIISLEIIFEELFISINNSTSYSHEFISNYLRISEELDVEKRKEYFSKFDTEKNTIIQSFEQKVQDLIFEFNNNYKLLQEDQNKLKKSSTLLIDNVDISLKNLNDLNERTQKLELEYSKIISNETEVIKKDLDTSRTTLLDVVHSIEMEANTKLVSINDAHTSFINLVQNAGIYELTQNYKTKADEEKSDYKLNMWLTVTAICLAIIATIAVITIPIVEHWKDDPAVDMDYFTLFARFTISIMFFVLALYTSKQAAKHYECYQENHRTFLQLAALEPFMSSMSPDEQKEIRKGLISTYFSQNVDGKFASKGDEVDISANLFSLLSQTLTIVADKKEVKPQDDKA